MEPFEIAANGWTFRAWSAGPPDGRLVLLLHGFPQSAWSWRQIIPRLAAAGFRAVAFDQRGYSPGARPEEVEAYAAAPLAADVAAIIRALGAEQADLVGHDWGAAVAWQVAGRHPELVRSLVTVSVPHPAAFAAALRDDTEQRERSAYMKIFRTPGHAEAALGKDDFAGLRRIFAGHVAPEDVERHVVVLAEPGALTAALNYYRAMDADSISGMGPVTAPTLYVWPSADIAFARSTAEACGDYVAGPYRFAVLDGVSHWAPEEAPGPLADLIIEHLA